MTRTSERLVAYGFLKKDKKAVIQLGDKIIKIEGANPREKIKFIQTLKTEYGVESINTALEKIADHEKIETAGNQILISSYPRPLSQYQVHLESFQKSIEHYYYWSINFLGDVGFSVVDKVTDTFTAAEQSSFYDVGARRMGLAQDKVGQYLATIGKMTKDMFALVREIRWLDERLMIYRGAFGENEDGKKIDTTGKKLEPQESSEITLKGLWVDLVDGVVGGQRTGSNLFTMASQLQFSALPDLFFGIHPKDTNEVDKVVDEKAAGFNKQVKGALKRKLKQYTAWRNSTYQEMKQRRIFTLDYLRQHYHTIRMYMQWVKPYVKHVDRLTQQQDYLDTARVVGAFESSIVEIEVIGRAIKAGTDKWACIMLHFEYHTKPSMQYSADGGYSRGPIHVGTTRITWRSYDWDIKKIQAYKAMRAREDLDVLASVNKSLKSAMDQLGDDILKYIEEAEHGKKKEEEKTKDVMSVKEMLEPFTALAEGFKDVFGALIPSLPKAKKMKKEGKSAAGTAKVMTWLHYNVFKKANGMLSW